VAVTAFDALVRHTPCVAAPALGERVWLKLESLQRTASFKLRGAALRLDALTAEERARGVVAASAGNHGQGVALAGGHLGVRTAVVVPTAAPAVKKRAMAAYGAEVIERGGGYDEAEAAARAIAAERGAVFVSPFDDPWVIRGNGGTLAEEILADRPDVALVVCPVGGGGLIGGLATVLAPRGVRVVGVQPAANCAMAESLRDGRAYTTYAGQPTLAEGCEGAVAEATYRLCREHGVTVALVDEAAIRRALAFAYRQLGQICEATAAVAIAGVREGVVASPARGATVVVVSGGNVEPALVDEVLREHGAR
jgi:threonine dehydratase